MGPLKADAVFEGGGVKGIGLAGALVAAEEEGYIWENVAGTSAGAIVASLIAVGYSALEIKNIIINADLMSFIDKTLLGRIPLLGPAASIMRSKGIYKGDSLECWLRDLYKVKGIEKFKDIRTRYNDERFMYKLRVIAVDICQKRLLVLPQDIRRYGIDPDSMDIAQAVRMSASIPFYYKPVTIEYKKGDKKCKSIIVDGGVLSNFPVWLFDEKGIPRWPTFGIKFIEPEYNNRQDEMNTVQYMLSIISTMMDALDERYIEAKNFERTIAIPTIGIEPTEFNISKERQEALFKSGYIAAKKFFRKWDFERYIREFRIQANAYRK